MGQIGGSLHRAAADEALRTVFGPEYGQLTMKQGELIITHLIELDNRERAHDLYKAAKHLGEIANRGLPAYVQELQLDLQ